MSYRVDHPRSILGSRAQSAKRKFGLLGTGARDVCRKSGVWTAACLSEGAGVTQTLGDTSAVNSCDPYSQFASQDVRPSGPNPLKSYSITYQQKLPGPPNPWNKCCAGKYSDPNWVYTYRCTRARIITIKHITVTIKYIMMVVILVRVIIMMIIEVIVMIIIIIIIRSPSTACAREPRRAASPGRPEEARAGGCLTPASPPLNYYIYIYIYIYICVYIHNTYVSMTLYIYI